MNTKARTSPVHVADEDRGKDSEQNEEPAEAVAEDPRSLGHGWSVPAVAGGQTEAYECPPAAAQTSAQPLSTGWTYG